MTFFGDRNTSFLMQAQVVISTLILVLGSHTLRTIFFGGWLSMFIFGITTLKWTEKAIEKNEKAKELIDIVFNDGSTLEFLVLQFALWPSLFAVFIKGTLDSFGGGF